MLAITLSDQQYDLNIHFPISQSFVAVLPLVFRYGCDQVRLMPAPTGLKLPDNRHTGQPTAFVESLFRTVKYMPTFPTTGFEDLEKCREYVQQFVRWYNEDHRHSGLCYVTPSQRHDGTAADILNARKQVYELAKAKHPERWVKDIRDFSLPEVVTLNPDRAVNC